MSSPLVSVIIPAYNSARTIERCIRALREQVTQHSYEIVVVHSGSDDTCERARRHCSDVRTIELRERALAARARNVGVKAAQGRVFAFIDSDAYAAPNWIDEAVAASETGYDLICGSIENAHPSSPVSRAEQLIMFNEFLADQPARPHWFALSGNTVMARSTYDRFGPLPEVRAAEDVVFSRNLIARGGRILFHPRLRVAHDNRTSVVPFVRNQFLLGRHTAMARRLVSFADVNSRTLLLLCLPFAPVIKLAKIALHVGRHRPVQALRVMRELPMLALGVTAYSLGMCQGATCSTDISVGGEMLVAPNSKAPMSGAAPAQGK